IESEIVSCEYFIDTDPGEGSATQVTIQQGASIDTSTIIDLGELSLSDGFHHIGIRTQDNQGRWSLVTARTFIKTTPPVEGNISSLQYYFTSDGYTSNIHVYDEFDESANVDVDFRADLSDLELGNTYNLHLSTIEDNSIKSLQYIHEFTVVLDTVAPAAPQNLTATVSQESINLKWSPNTEEDLYKYNIYRDTSSPATTLLHSIIEPSPEDTFYVDENIESEQIYYYRITAYDYDWNMSGYSNEVNVTPFWGPVWHISTSGSDETGLGSESSPFATIQYGIEITYTGDTVLVHPGTYAERINFNGKSIVVLSSNGQGNTIIDGSPSGNVVKFMSGEDSSSVLSGFTITGGAVSNGGGIYCNYGSSPNLENLIIKGNQATNGGGIYCNNNSSPTLKYLRVNENQATNGGGIYCASNSNPSLRNVLINSNEASYAGGGIYCNNSNPNLINITMADNSANQFGGGIFLISGAVDSLLNSILWDNSPNQVFFAPGGSSDSITVAYSDVQDGESGIVTNDNGIVNWGDGNIKYDPLFVNAEYGDYHLQVTSPCLNAGDPASDYSNEPEPNGNRINMGAYGNTSEAAMPLLEFTVSPDTLAQEDTIYSIDVSIPPEPDVTVNYHSLCIPGWLSFNDTTAILQGTPNNANVGDTTISIAACDNYSRTDTLTYILSVLNREPHILTQADTTAVEDIPYYYDINSDDEGQGIVRYSAYVLPSWLTLDSLSGEIGGIPTNYDTGDTIVSVQVSDGNGGTDSQLFTLHVQNINDAPVISNIPDTSLAEDDSLSLDLDDYVEDVDHPDSALTWDVSLLEGEGLLLSVGHHKGNFEKSYKVEGKYLSGRFNKLNPRDTNFNDELSTNPIQSKGINQTDRTLETQDDSITVVIDPVTHIVTFTATENYFVENVPFLFTVTDDSGAADSDTMHITVTAINDPPVLSAIPDTSFAEDDTLSFGLDEWYSYVEDIDNADSTLAWKIEEMDSVFCWIIEENIFFNAPKNWFGEDTLSVMVSDSFGLEDTTDLVITVLSINDPPVISDFPDSIVFRADSSVALDLNDYVNDVDDPASTLTWSVSGNDSVVVSINDTTNVATLSSPLTWSGRETLIFTVIDDSSASDSDTLIVYVTPLVGIDFEEYSQIPKVYSLSQSYPNPFNPHAVIEYQLPVQSHVKLVIYNILGQKVRTLINEEKNVGYYRIIWDARSESGEQVSSGIYIYQIIAGDFIKTKRMILMR
ncbi:MAG: hypothetical protein DRP89_02660, partial [Candidatus Neomarinimicrobiota bacterium]